AGWECGGIPSIAVCLGSCPPGVERYSGEGAARRRPAADAWIPDETGSFRGHFDQRRQRTEYEIRQHLADHMARRYRRGPLGVEHAAQRGSNLDRREAAMIARDVRVEQAVDAERRIGRRIVQDHVDAVSAAWRGTSEIKDH